MHPKLMALIILISGLAISLPVTAAELLVYKVWEPGAEPYISRMLVTDKHVRLDEGGDSETGYTLYDRTDGTIYNVSHEDQSVTVMQALVPLPPRPQDLVLTEKVEIDEEAPTIAGVKPQRVQLLANGVVCRDLVTLPGVMNSATDGLKQFRQSLALIQGARLEAWPEESRTPCDLSELIYEPTRGLSHGLAIQDRTATMSQSLLDFVEGFKAEASLFKIPEGYDRMSMPGL
ncbi:MAG: hypothetical protein ACWA5Q_09290 [bacterium]